MDAITGPGPIILNGRGLRLGEGAAPARNTVAELCRGSAYWFSHADRAAERGVVCMDEACCEKHLGVARCCSASRSEIYEACFLCPPIMHPDAGMLCVRSLPSVLATTSCGDLLLMNSSKKSACGAHIRHNSHIPFSQAGGSLSCRKLQSFAEQSAKVPVGNATVSADHSLSPEQNRSICRDPYFTENLE